MRDPDIESQVLNVLDRLLACGAYRQLTMADVARATGLALSRVLLHFRTKEDLLLAQADRMVRGIVAAEKEIAAQPGETLEKMRRVLLYRVLAYFDNVQHFGESLDEIYRDIRNELFERRRFYAEWEAQVLESLLREMPDIGTLGHGCVIAHALLTATNALLPWNCVSSELGTRRQLGRRAEKIIDVLLAALPRVSGSIAIMGRGGALVPPGPRRAKGRLPSPRARRFDRLR